MMIIFAMIFRERDESESIRGTTEELTVCRHAVSLVSTVQYSTPLDPSF